MRDTLQSDAEVLSHHLAGHSIPRLQWYQTLHPKPEPFTPPEPLLAGTNTSGIQNRLGVLFFMLLYLSLMALTSLPIWRDEKLLFLRERDSGAYGTPAYFAAVVLFDLLPMRIIPPTFFALFSYWMIGLHQSSAVCLLWFIGALGSVVKALGCSE